MSVISLLLKEKISNRLGFCFVMEFKLKLAKMLNQIK